MKKGMSLPYGIADQMQRCVDAIWEVCFMDFPHSRASAGKQALYVPPAPGMARAAASEAAIRALDLGVLQDYATRVLH